jgi:molybdopterin/thiamine biosynthesis adenylyltransferase/rhodanese-related sulfurtransferase
MTGRTPGLPVLSAEELRRYARHLVLPHVGIEGQRRLKAARVLLVGVGGLGSPAALYLAAAGIGTLGLVDADAVDLTNLQRQVLHGTAAVGRSKLGSAEARLRDLNPSVTIERHETRLTGDNALGILGGYDVIVDGSDNFPTRYLVNDACGLLGKPDVYGSVHRFEGQVSVFWAERGPCYRCLYRDPPPPELVPSCEEGGVLGVLPGIVGTLQATEAIKLILGAGTTLTGRLLLVDALTMRFREMALEKDPDCPLCGPRRTLDRLIDYDAFCGVGRTEPRGEGMGLELTVQELRDLLAAGAKPVVVDVRERWEFDIGHLAGSVHIPLGTLPERMAELDQAAEIVTVCHTGRRSLQAAHFMHASGFARVRSLRGGTEAWAVQIDPAMPRY